MTERRIETPTGTVTIVVGTNAEMLSYMLDLTPSDEGKYIFYNTDYDTIYFWDGSNWR